MRKFTLIATVFLPAFLLSQPVITFDEKVDVMDWGEIYTDTTYRRDVWFTNTGDSALIITRIGGSGGLYASWPREIIEAGERAAIKIVFNTDGRKGNNHKSLSIKSNAKNPVQVINVKSRVINRSTSIKVLNKVIELDTILFGNVDTITFEVVNTGRNNLYVQPIDAGEEVDILYCHLDKYWSHGYREGYKPGDTVRFTLLIKNAFGHLGSFERKLLLRYNHYFDTITLKGTFVGQPGVAITFEGENMLFYQNMQLVKSQSYYGPGKVRKEKLYKEGLCYYAAVYHINDEHQYGIYREEFFKEGLLVKTIQH